jgi:16S rRNA (cytosine967-C5)-methyltransferase
MRLPGRAAAAVEILTEIFVRHRPAADALQEWGRSHRFAGSSDRHAIGTIVYDALRNKLSAAAIAGHDTPRGMVLGVLRSVWKLDVPQIEALATEPHGLGALTADEVKALSNERTPMSDHVRGNFPSWLEPSLRRQFGNRAVTEMQALAQRAPIDLRVNSLKATREQVIEALQSYQAQQGPLSSFSVRIAAPGQDQRHINVEAEIAHGKGWYEVQDSASQVAAFLSGVKPGERVADICAGAGGKTLALAAMMNNAGTIVAYDNDKRRLRPIFDRLTRAGVTCVDVQDDVTRLAVDSFDCVLVDAPCTGSGSWRRKPDAKWRLKPAQLEIRRKEQRDVLATASKLTQPGGRIVYITCSILPEENAEQVDAFLALNNAFKLVPYHLQWPKAFGPVAESALGKSNGMLLLTPAQHDTDGFFVAVLQRS